MDAPESVQLTALCAAAGKAALFAAYVARCVEHDDAAYAEYRRASAEFEGDELDALHERDAYLRYRRATLAEHAARHRGVALDAALEAMRAVELFCNDDACNFPDGGS